MGDAAKTIIIVFIAFFALSIIVSLIMNYFYKQKRNDQSVQDDDAVEVFKNSDITYIPADFVEHHSLKQIEDIRFGYAVEVIETKRLKCFLKGSFYLLGALIILFYGEQLVTVNTNDADFAPGGILLNATIVGLIVYSFYWYTWIFKHVVLFKEGFSYYNKFLQKRYMLYSEVNYLSGQKEWLLKYSYGTRAYDPFGNLLMKKIWFRYVARFGLKKKSIIGNFISIELLEVHYKYLEEKIEHLKRNMFIENKGDN